MIFLTVIFSQCMLERVGSWNFDIFLFDRLTNGKYFNSDEPSYFCVWMCEICCTLPSLCQAALYMYTSHPVVVNSAICWLNRGCAILKMKLWLAKFILPIIFFVVLKETVLSSWHFICWTSMASSSSSS